MSFYTTADEFSLRHLTEGYPWDSISGTVVDLGGSHGDAAFAMAAKYPDLRFIVQDLPSVIENAQRKQGINVDFMAHDFFTEQPVNGADVYYSRWTLHNWPDKYCVRILKALVPALKKGAKVLLVECNTRFQW